MAAMPEPSSSRRPAAPQPAARPASQRLGSARPQPQQAPPPPPPPTSDGDSDSSRSRRRPTAASTRAKAPDASASRRVPPPPPQGPPRPGTDRTPKSAVREAQPPRRPAASRMAMYLAMGGVGLLAILVIVLAAVWGPMQRSSQLKALDAAAANVEESRRLAKLYCLEWNPRSEFVREAITTGRGSVEARVVLARTGKHLDLLAGLVAVADATPAQRADVLEALAEDWPEDAKEAPTLPGELAQWIADPKTDDVVAIAAAHLLGSANAPDAAKTLATGTMEKGSSDARALACAESLSRLVNRANGSGLSDLLACLRGPHRAAMIASPVIAEAVKNQSGPDQTPVLLDMLATADVRAMALAGLAGPRMELGSDPAKRAAFAAKLAPSLSPDADDAVLAGALKTVRRHKLLESRVQLLALLSRLGKHQLPGLDGNDMAEIIGGLADDRTPAQAAASNELVEGLAAALAVRSSRVIAAGSLAAVQARDLPALRGALHELVGYPEDQICNDALSVIVSKRFGRSDLAALAGSRGWGPVLADSQRRIARYDSIRAWIKDHADDTTVKAGKERLDTAKQELARYRDEVRGWLDQPPPLGVSRTDLMELANQINLMADMVIKAWSAP